MKLAHKPLPTDQKINRGKHGSNGKSQNVTPATSFLQIRDKLIMVIKKKFNERLWIWYSQQGNVYWEKGTGSNHT